MKKIILTEKWYDNDVGEFSDKINYYLLDTLPQPKEYFDFGKDKGYMVFALEDDEKNIIEKDYKLYTIYYEQHLGQFEGNKNIFLDYCFVAIRKGE